MKKEEWDRINKEPNDLYTQPQGILKMIMTSERHDIKRENRLIKKEGFKVNMLNCLLDEIVGRKY